MNYFIQVLKRWTFGPDHLGLKPVALLTLSKFLPHLWNEDSNSNTYLMRLVKWLNNTLAYGDKIWYTLAIATVVICLEYIV
jgi:hypothetical protein